MSQNIFASIRLAALPRSPTPRRLVLVGAALLLEAAVAWAGPVYPGRWTTHGYNERKPSTPPPAKVTQPPVRYTITIAVFPPKAAPAEMARDNPDSALVVAHLPEGAPLWLEDTPTRQRGKLRHFRSPPLKPRHRYSYTARVVWYEDGQWVSQTLKVPVWAGRTTCLFLAKPSALAGALEELSPADRKLASGQKFCAVQPENLLGAMGKPVKVTIKGQPVFLCCAECVKQARSAPERTLARARELRAMNARAPGQ
jgi:uncharacterized protein (TIGR03000 family)